MADCEDLDAVGEDFVEDPVRRFDYFPDLRDAVFGNKASHQRVPFQCFDASPNPLCESVTRTSRECVETNEYGQECFFGFRGPKRSHTRFRSRSKTSSVVRS